MDKITDSFIQQRLTNVARLDFANDNFIHDQIFTNISNLKKKDGKIARMGNEHMRNFGTTKRSSYDESSHRVEFKYQDDATYKIETHDAEVFLPKDFITQADRPFNAANDARMFLEGVRNVSMEKAIADVLNDNTILTNYSTPTVKWDVYATSSPFTDLETARKAIEDATGKTPNRCIIQSDVVSALKTHPDFVGRMQGFNRPMVLTKDNVLSLIQDFLGLPEKPMVAMSRYISTAPGQTETKAAIWAEDVILYYAPTTGTLWTPSFGYRLTRGGVTGTKKITTRNHPSDPDLGVMVKMAWEYQDKILDVNCAYLLDGVLT